jgi:hypothetical protein
VQVIKDIGPSGIGVRVVKCEWYRAASDIGYRAASDVEMRVV